MEDGIFLEHLPQLWGVPIFPAEKLWLFVLVLARVSGVVTTAPFLSGVHVPIRFRALLALILALVVFPTQWDAVLPLELTLPEVALLIGSQWVVGAGVGLAVAIVLGILYLTGELIARTAGLMLADIFDPLSDSEASPVAQFAGWMGAAVFFVTGAYRWPVDSLLASFHYLPVAATVDVSSFWTAMVFALSHSFASALQFAAPVVLMLLASTLILGFLGRTLPQLNILAVGLGLNGIITILALALALGGIVRIFGEQLAWWQERTLVDLLAPELR